MAGAQEVANAFPEYPCSTVKVYPPAVHLKDYISMAGPEIMAVSKSPHAQKTFQVEQVNLVELHVSFESYMFVFCS